MANVVVTSSTKYVKVVFNDYAGAVNMTQGYFSKEHLAEVRALDSGTVSVRLDDGSIFTISTDGVQNSLLIDSVDGVTPTDNDDLCDKIATLMDY